MFTTLIIQPIFNLLVLIYAIIPGHNFGLAIVIFTVLIRILMWPLVRKQLHQAKAMRELQPELKRIKEASKGDRQQESRLVMELYREKKINPFASIGLLIVQLPIFIGLYSVLRRIVVDPYSLINSSYPFIQNLGWMKELAHDISKFDHTLFGIVDLTKAATAKGRGIYWPAMFIVIGSAIAQYYQSKQLLPNDKEKRSLRKILREASSGQKADQSEVNAAVGRSTRYFLPALIFLITVNLASALSLYWFTSGLTAFIQQAKVLKQDKTELVDAADRTGKKVIEGEVLVQKPAAGQRTKKKKKSAKKRKKR